MKGILTWILIFVMLMQNTAYAEGWKQENSNWYYEQNGAKQTGWINDGTGRYHFDENGKMQTGWYQENQIWYFLNTVHDGFYGKALSNQWAWIDGYCYLFDADGKMYANCITPDGYEVNADGRWTVNGVVQFIGGKGIITTAATPVSGKVSGGITKGGGGSGGGGGSAGGGGESGSGNNSGEPSKNGGVVFVDEVEIKNTEFTLDEESQTIVIADSAVTDGWKEGNVYVLKDKSSPENDIAIKLIAIENIEQGIVIHYEEPAIEEVIKSIDVQGTQVVSGSFTPAEGVTVVPVKNYRSRTAIKDTVNLFEEYKIEGEWEGITLSSIFKTESVEYSIVTDDTSMGLEEVSLIFNNTYNGTIQYNQTLEKSVEITLGEINVLLPYGFIVSGKMSLAFDSNGNIVIGFKMNNVTGGHYTKSDGFTPEFSLKGGISSVKLEGSMSLCIVLAPEVSILKIRLIGNETKAGIGFDGKAEILSRDPLALCMDGKNYWILDESIDVGPEMMTLYHYEKSIYNVDNALIDNLHIEETGIVPECTRKQHPIQYGTLEFEVWENYLHIPMDHIKCEVIQDGKVFTTVYTNESGFCSIQLPVGKYKVRVSDPEYITQEVEADIFADTKTTIYGFFLVPNVITGEYEGIVINAGTGYVAECAKIELVNEDGSIADTVYIDGRSGGRFKGTPTAEGKYILRVSDIDYYTYEKPIEIIRGETVFFEIYLYPRPSLLNQITDVQGLNLEEHNQNTEQLASPSNAKKEEESANTDDNIQDEININVNETEDQENEVVVDEMQITDTVQNEDNPESLNEVEELKVLINDENVKGNYDTRDEDS